MNNSRETQDFERWIIEKLIRYGLNLDSAKVVEADPPKNEQLVDASNPIQGAIVDSNIKKEN